MSTVCCSACFRCVRAPPCRRWLSREARHRAHPLLRPHPRPPRRSVPSHPHKHASPPARRPSRPRWHVGRARGRPSRRRSSRRARPWWCRAWRPRVCARHRHSARHPPSAAPRPSTRPRASGTRVSKAATPRPRAPPSWASARHSAMRPAPPRRPTRAPTIGRAGHPPPSRRPPSCGPRRPAETSLSCWMTTCSTALCSMCLRPRVWAVPGGARCSKAARRLPPRLSPRGRVQTGTRFA